MSLDLSRFRFVVVESPYDTFEQELTQRLFGRFIGMKLAGYKKEYPDGVLPLGVYDFVSHLIMLCEKKGDDWIPLFTLKSSDTQICARFNLPFEFYELFMGMGARMPDYRRAVDQVLASARAEGKIVGYTSSWTLNPDMRQISELKSLFKELSLAAVYLFYTSYGIEEVLIGGATKFKVDQLQASLGFDPLYLDGEPMLEFKCPFLFGASTLPKHLKVFSPYAKALGDKYRFLWNARMTIKKLETGGRSVAA